MLTRHGDKVDALMDIMSTGCIEKYKVSMCSQDMVTEVDALMDIMSTGCIEKYKVSMCSQDMVTKLML